MSSIRRATLEKSNDDPKMQEADFNLSHGEKATGIEHMHPYGFSARPLPPKDKKRAEAIIVFPDGNRSQGVALMVGDRRYRLKAMKEGEVALHDDQNNKVHLTRDGIVVAAAKKITHQVGKSSIVMDGDSITLKSPNIKFE